MKIPKSAIDCYKEFKREGFIDNNVKTFVLEAKADDMVTPKHIFERLVTRDNWCTPFERVGLIRPGGMLFFGPRKGEENHSQLMNIPKTFETISSKAIGRTRYKGTFIISNKSLALDGICTHSLKLTDSNNEYLASISISITKIVDGGTYTGTNINYGLGSNKEAILNFLIDQIFITLGYFDRFNEDKEQFILETSPARLKKGKIKKSSWSLFRYLHINDIRRNYIPRDNGGSTTVGYERCQHLRTYRHERYVNMRGKTVVIKSTWIGPTETFKDDILYKVHINNLDRFKD